MVVVGELGAGDIVLEGGGFAQGETIVWAQVRVALENDFAVLAIEVDLAKATIDESVGPVAHIRILLQIYAKEIRNHYLVWRRRRVFYLDL